MLTVAQNDFTPRLMSCEAASSALHCHNPPLVVTRLGRVGHRLPDCLIVCLLALAFQSGILRYICVLFWPLFPFFSGRHDLEWSDIHIQGEPYQMTRSSPTTSRAHLSMLL
jgi:hypothetical protein